MACASPGALFATMVGIADVPSRRFKLFWRLCERHACSCLASGPIDCCGTSGSQSCSSRPGRRRPGRRTSRSARSGAYHRVFKGGEF